MPNNKKTIYLEITTKCNLACPFCPSSDEKNHFDMDIKKCKEVIDKIKVICYNNNVKKDR